VTSNTVITLLSGWLDACPSLSTSKWFSLSDQDVSLYGGNRKEFKSDKNPASFILAQNVHDFYLLQMTESVK